MIRRPPRSTLSSSSAASDVYKRQVGTRVRKTTGGSAAQKAAAVGKTVSKEDMLDATDGGGSHNHSRSSSPGGAAPGSTTANTDASLRHRSFSTRSKSFISVQYVTSQKMGVASPLNLLAQEPASVMRKPSMRRNSSSAFAADPVSYTHLRAHETPEHLVCRLLLEKKKNTKHTQRKTL
eukprot:TRINITY_DN24899_c0_g1_i1.p1 TRINITY_DN24899_c0_g1~~TRINITY_DN24899_c0_g1_i1.p1  ORF type:complete len:179 (+),score=42.79 TRINITY_DN24899_c0_g1_i1:92-628(+)